MNLLRNTLIEWLPVCEDSQPLIERILYVKDETGLLIIIDITSKNALPITRKCEEISQLIENGHVRVLSNDPYSVKITQEEHIQPKHKKRRDEAYELIREIIELEGIDQYLPWKRGKIVTRIASENKKSKQHIYDLLRRYWQFGQTRNALLPLYKRSGAPGKRRLGTSIKDEKLGKPSNKSKEINKKIGVRTTLNLEKKFLRGVRRFYDKKNKRKSLKAAFQRILETYFNIGYELKDDVLIPILPPAHELPTFRQFRYWYEKHYYDAVQSTKNRYGETTFNLKNRELLGDATSIAFGPGSVYQIDATIADIYLVSALNRNKIVGRPVIYVVIDVFSRMIVGIAVLLEGPSWYGAMLALDNVVEDKVAYCARHGITIKPDDWKGNALSENILADRGEFEGYNVESLINNFGITVKNTAPYRADWKSIVERHFGIATEKFIKYSPGGVIKERERGDRDYRLDAIYTLHEFEALVIAHILNYNEAHELRYYRKDEFQIAEEVERFPIDLWNWGMETRTGHLQNHSRETVRLNLLPRKEVSVTEQGIHFSHQLYYTCETAEREGWFARARIRGSWKISIAYHPHSSEHIYLPTNDGRNAEVCKLTPASQTFEKSDFFSVENYYYQEAIASEDARDRIYRSDAEFNARHEHITKEATEKTQLAKYDAGEQSKKSQTEGIRDNRLDERNRERQLDAWDEMNKPKSEIEESISSNEFLNEAESNQTQEHYVPAQDYTDFLSELLEEHQHQKNK
jgi:putative transposase